MPGPSSRVKTFTQDDRRIAVRAGDRFTIELSGIPGAGYEWSLSPGSLASLVKREVLPAAGIGGAAAYRFHLLAATAGVESMQAAYRRAWEPEARTIVTFELAVAE